MPTFAWLSRFGAEFDALSPGQQATFLLAVTQFVEDLQRGQGFRPGLRVKRVQGTRSVFEMTWADDGRATFSYGDAVIDGQPHIIWRRIGSHAIFKQP